MEGVAAAASIGQLVQYGGVVTVTLIRLIKDISRGPLIYKNEESNVRLLLRLVHRISTEAGCHTRNECHEDFVELFTRVDHIAHNILQLLGNTSSFVTRAISALTRHRSLSEAFQALCAARELLHLQITSTLSRDVRAYLEAGRHQLDSPMNTFNALVDIGDDVVAESHNPRVAPPRDRGPVIMNNTSVERFATMNLGDKPRGNFKETLEVHRRIDPARIPASGPLDQQAYTAMQANSPREERQHQTIYRHESVTVLSREQSKTTANPHERPQPPVVSSGAAGSHGNTLNPKGICSGGETSRIEELFGDDTDDDEPNHNGERAKLYQTR
ncbi:cytochrome P450 [Apiospora arundinis]